jgi:hypothetical protein
MYLRAPAVPAACPSARTPAVIHGIHGATRQCTSPAQPQLLRSQPLPLQAGGRGAVLAMHRVSSGRRPARDRASATRGPGRRLRRLLTEPTSLVNTTCSPSSLGQAGVMWGRPSGVSWPPSRYACPAAGSRSLRRGSSDEPWRLQLRGKTAISPVAAPPVATILGSSDGQQHEASLLGSSGKVRVGVAAGRHPKVSAEWSIAAGAGCHTKVLPGLLGGGVRGSGRAAGPGRRPRSGWPHRSLPRMWVTCFLVLSSATTRSRAMRWLELPAASSRSASSSRSVGGSARPGGAATGVRRGQQPGSWVRRGPDALSTRRCSGRLPLPTRT